MAAALIVIVASPASAKETHVFKRSFGSAGAGPGQLALAEHSGVAIDQTSGDIYVADTGNHRVDQFEADGTFLRSFGSFTAPTFVAVDNSPGGEGDVYVADTTTDTISKFTAGGTLVSSWGTAGQLGGFAALAGIAVGPGGDFFVLEENNEVHVFTQAGAGTSTFTSPRGTAPRGLAVDSEGNLYKIDGAPQVTKFSPTGENLANELDPREDAVGLTLDPSDESLYVVQEGSGGFVNQFAHNCGDRCEPIDSFSSSHFQTPGGIAVNAASGDAYVLNTASSTIIVLASVILPDSLTSPATEVTPTTAVLNGEVNPAGTEASYQFEYGTTTSYGQLSPAPPAAVGNDNLSHPESTEVTGLIPNTTYHFRIDGINAAGSDPGADLTFRTTGPPTVTSTSSSAITRTCATLEASVNPDGFETAVHFQYGTTESYGSETTPVDIGAGTGPQPTATEVCGLTLGTVYHFRAVATNTQGTVNGADDTLITVPALLIDATSVSGVSADSATLETEINPLGSPTGYHFEYGTTTAYGTELPIPDASIGSGSADVFASAQINGLQPLTTYHYRVLAHNAFGPVEGPDHTFTTQAIAASALLDGRQYQLVSPPDKGGGVIQSIYEHGGVTEAAESGAAITYLTNAPTEPEAPGSTTYVQVLSSRGSAGWSTHDIANPYLRAQGTGQGNFPAEDGPFASDLSAGLVQPRGLFQPHLSPEAIEQTPYLRNLGSCQTTCFQPLVSGANALPGFGEERPCEREGGTAVSCGPQIVAADPSLSDVVINSAAPLVTGAPTGNLGPDGRVENGSLYEWSAGHLQLISILPPATPGGEELPAPPGAASLGYGVGKLIAGKSQGRGAISADGSRLFWSTSGPIASQALYLRDTSAATTVQLDTAESGCVSCESGGGEFQFASADGSRVFFTDAGPLTETSGKGDLYECAIVEPTPGHPDCSLTDLTPKSVGGEADVVGSILGASEDGSYLYFVANGIVAHNTVDHGAGPESARSGDCLAAGNPPSTACNLYVLHEGTTSFITTLSGADQPNWSGSAERQPTRVSPNGHWLSLMSEGALTGYDNRDVISRKPDAELYLYDATAGSLTCPSCNPSGARPHGVEFGQFGASGAESLVGKGGNWESSAWVAALPPQSSSLEQFVHQPRYLSDSGRLFFNAADALVPQDSNSNWDVYEYEPAGVGDCSSAAPGFQPATQSCLGLISSGTSGKESALLDASESGADAFFLTSSRLAPEDVDSARDIYDAHECSAAVPCFPPPAPSPPACEGDACQAPATPPNDQTPGSLTFQGAGNVLECPKGKVKKSGKCVKKQSKKKHHKKKSHKKQKKSKRANTNRGGVK